MADPGGSWVGTPYLLENFVKNWQIIIQFQAMPMMDQAVKLSLNIHLNK